MVTAHLANVHMGTLQRLRMAKGVTVGVFDGATVSIPFGPHECER